MDKIRYSRSPDEKLFWENYVLPKYAVFIQSAATSFVAHKQAMRMSENEELMEHEIGQVSDGVQFITATFKGFIDEKIRKARSLHRKSEFYDNLEISFNELLEKTKLYCDDIEGQFHVVNLMMKVYMGEIVADPQKFDCYHEFLHRWRNCFTAGCRIKNNWIEINKTKTSDPVRQMYTDPNLLEHAVYNLVNNAIKYSYVNTRVYVKLERNVGGAGHVFTVTDYGVYVDDKNLAIFDKGVRGLDNTAMTVLPDDNIEIGNRAIKGKGIGLYWAKRLVDILGGDIICKCEEISKFYVPLMKPFIDRYNTVELFRQVWEQMNFGGNSLPYDVIWEEYDRLCRSSEYQSIVNDHRQDKLKNLGIYKIFDEMRTPTYKVTFTLAIPPYEKGGE
ncbi:hypothetical protein AGMMS49975_24990 [Clostridia bacterium]|nr:hypothetical protein AGMMS49975_24990 [Clostridia bacterium]